MTDRRFTDAELQALASSYDAEQPATEEYSAALQQVLEEAPQAPENAESHLGNALCVLRLAKGQRQRLTLEEFGAVYARVQAALRELERGNV